MDWLGQAAAQIREWLIQKAWFDGWQSTIASTPDWALLAAGPATLLLLALLLRITWPGLRTSEIKPKAPHTQKQSRHQRSAKVVPVSEATKSPTAAAPAPEPPAAQPAAPPIPIADDDEDNRSVRVFVSSTFLDMQSERDELVTKTFPALRARYRARGVEVFEVDLRWGITREQQERGETLPTLLAEIDRCRPYFIGLLGDRYGWVPPSEALTDKLKADFPIFADAQGASVTAMEIMHGVLSHPDGAARACLFERDPDWDWRATLNDADRASAGEEPESACAKLEDLKTLIRQKARVEPYASPQEIGEKVTAALNALLEARFPETQAPDAFEQTTRLHRAYARERRGLHVGAEGYVRDLNHWMEAKDSAPLLITGASGGGKSTLVANWINAWRKAHPSDIIFEHYLGASPDSADPMLIMRRVWEQLNRTTGESAVLPGDNAELMDMSAALAQCLARARLSAERGGSRMLVALDGLDKLSSEQNLRWLPVVPGVRWLASSLPGEAETAARARGFATLDVNPLSEQQRRVFIAGTLKRWRRDLEPEHIARILQPAAAELAGSPLYLKTVLEELRVSADNSRLTKRLEDYRGALDMPDLFDRVLKRLEEDCEPGLVAKALPLIWASRAGIEETELLAIVGASPLAWATLRNALSDGLRDQQGRIAFGHDYLNQAVVARYVETEEQRRSAHLAIADRFEARVPDARQAEELPHQLHAAKAWDRLEALLVDVDRFMLLQGRGDGELWGYWLPLKKRGRDPEALLCGTFEATAGAAERWSQAEIDLADELSNFLHFAGATGDASSRLGESLVAAFERTLGPEHPSTLTTMNNVAETFAARGDLQRAQTMQERVLEAKTRTLGPEHPSTLTTMNNLAQTLSAQGDWEGARSMQERVLETRMRTLGGGHPSTLTTENNLARTLSNLGDLEGAETMHERVLEGWTRTLGPEHPSTLISMCNFAGTLKARGDLAGAQTMQERALEAQTRVLGPEHPDTLETILNLASTLSARGELEAAQSMQERVLETRMRTLSPEHPDTLTCMNNLSLTLKARGDLAGAQTMQERALEAQTRVLGPEHFNTLISMRNLARTLSDCGDLDGALRLAEHALTVATRRYGSEHPLSENTSSLVAWIRRRIQE